MQRPPLQHLSTQRLKMPPTSSNPHEAVVPDFASEEHADGRAAIMGRGFNNSQAAAALRQLWLIINVKAQQEWDRALAAEEERAEVNRQLAEVAELLLCQQALAEKEAATTDDKKKHQNKFVPVPNAKVPLELVPLPAKYVLKQMEMSGYVELYYFTNKGISEAEEVATAAGNGSLVWKLGNDGSHSLVKASTGKRGLKNDPFPDEKLTWEQFFEATPCMIKSMVRFQWPEDHVDMFRKLWLGMQKHQFRTSTDMFSKEALLVYQAKQRRLWHHTIGTLFGFSLTEIEEELLKRTRDELVQTAFNMELKKMQLVSSLSPSPPARSSEPRTSC